MLFVPNVIGIERVQQIVTKEKKHTHKHNTNNKNSSFKPFPNANQETISERKYEHGTNLHTFKIHIVTHSQLHM